MAVNSDENLDSLDEKAGDFFDKVLADLDAAVKKELIKIAPEAD